MVGPSYVEARRERGGRYPVVSPVDPLGGGLDWACRGGRVSSYRYSIERYVAYLIRTVLSHSGTVLIIEVFNPSTVSTLSGSLTHASRMVYPYIMAYRRGLTVMYPTHPLDRG